MNLLCRLGFHAGPWRTVKTWWGMETYGPAGPTGPWQFAVLGSPWRTDERTCRRCGLVQTRQRDDTGRAYTAEDWDRIEQWRAIYFPDAPTHLGVG